jgi:hypothetical protein
MTRALNHSDIDLIRSERHDEKRFICGPAQTSSPANACSAADRANCTRLIDRDLQAVWPTQLSLQGRTWTRTQAIFVHDRPNRRTPMARLCAERNLPASRRVSWQLPDTTADAQRDLRDQCRAAASPREARLNGPGRRSPRFYQGGRHHRQHDRILSCCRRYAVHRGRSRSC